MRLVIITLLATTLAATVTEDYHRLDTFNIEDGTFNTMSFEGARRKSWVASEATRGNLIVWAINDRILIANNREECSGEYPYFSLDIRANQMVCAKEAVVK